jgi:thioredoxin reductase
LALHRAAAPYNPWVDTPQAFDCIIIGGGAAGLSAALVLARAHRTAALIDNGRQSNLPTLEAHSVFSRDGIAPDELYRIVREQLAKHISVVTVDDTALKVNHLAEGFSVTLAGGSQLQGRLLLLAQGVDYELPSIPGLHDLWGRKAFHCPYCDGYEMTNQRLLAIGDDQWRESMGGTLPNWTRCLTWAAPADVLGLCDSQTGVQATLQEAVDVPWTTHEQLVRTAGTVEAGSVEAAAGECAGNGQQVEYDRVIVQTTSKPRDGIADSLGCARNEKGQLVIDEGGRTSVSGVFAAGDQADVAAYINVAAASGHLAGVAINVALGEVSQ